MALERFLEMSGVQMMLRNLISAAAPELSKQVEDVAQVVLAFKQQADRIERNQQRIMARLGLTAPAQEVIDHDNSSGLAERSGRADGAGSDARS